MNTDRIGLHEVLLPINHNYNKIFKIKLQEIPRFFLVAVKKKAIKCACAMAHTRAIYTRKNKTRLT